MDNILGNITKEEFLKSYWQKKPLLIKQAIPEFELTISPDELAGLACEESVESRIVMENNNGKAWDCMHGPFDESDFSQLPKSHWTLLIQGLDTLIPEVSDLLNYFRFIPNWRVDDIMASYAPVDGSVGPHFDFYDVFLLQARGKRRWLTGQHCDEHSPRLTNTPLRILKTFETENDWVLEPGDMLYLPPQIAHHGISQGDCITLSIGFRSPSHDEVWSSFADHICSTISREIHLDDENMTTQANPGEIQTEVIDKLKEIITHYSTNDTLSSWFGRYSTEPKSEHIIEPPDDLETEETLLSDYDPTASVRWNEGSRFCFYDANSPDTTIRFFYDGNEQLRPTTDRAFIEKVCSTNSCSLSELLLLTESGNTMDLLLELLNSGHLYIEDE